MDSNKNILNYSVLPCFLLILLIAGGKYLSHVSRIISTESNSLGEHHTVFTQRGLKGVASIFRTKKSEKPYYKKLFPADYDKIEVLKGTKEVTHFLGYKGSRIWILPRKRSSLDRKDLYSCQKLLHFDQDNNLLHIEDEGKKWLASGNGKKIIEYSKNIERIEGSLFRVDDKYLFTSSHIQEHELYDKIVSPMFTDDYKLKREYKTYDNLIAVCQNGKWGAITHTGKVLFPCEAEEFKFKENNKRSFLCLRKGNKWAFINSYAKEFEFIYDSLEVFTNKFGSEVLLFTNGEKIGILNNGGREIYTNKNVTISTFEKGPGYLVVGNGKTIILNYSAEKLIETDEKLLRYLSEGIFVLEKNGSVRLVNRYKKQIYDKPIEDADELDNFSILITAKGKQGIINKNGDEKIPALFDKISYSAQEKKLNILHGPLSYEFNINNLNSINNCVSLPIPTPIPAPLYNYVFSKSFNSYYKNFLNAPDVMVKGYPYKGTVLSLNKQASSDFLEWQKKWREIIIFDYKISNYATLSKNELLKKLKETKATQIKVQVHESIAYPFNFNENKVFISASSSSVEPIRLQSSYIELDGKKLYKVGANNLIFVKPVNP